jgi:hypothetical protein
MVASPVGADDDGGGGTIAYDLATYATRLKAAAGDSTAPKAAAADPGAAVAGEGAVAAAATGKVAAAAAGAKPLLQVGWVCVFTCVHSGEASETTRLEPPPCSYSCSFSSARVLSALCEICSKLLRYIRAETSFRSSISSG